MDVTSTRGAGRAHQTDGASHQMRANALSCRIAHRSQTARIRPILFQVKIIADGSFQPAECLVMSWLCSSHPGENMHGGDVV